MLVNTKREPELLEKILDQLSQHMDKSGMSLSLAVYIWYSDRRIRQDPGQSWSVLVRHQPVDVLYALLRRRPHHRDHFVRTLPSTSLDIPILDNIFSWKELEFTWLQARCAGVDEGGLQVLRQRREGRQGHCIMYASSSSFSTFSLVPHIMKILISILFFFSLFINVFYCASR